MLNKTIFIPSQLFVWNDDIEIDVKKFILNFYIDLKIRAGMDNRCLYSLFDLIKNSSGRTNYANAYRLNYFIYAKKAIEHLQNWGLIEEIRDNNNNIISITAANPRDLLWFKIKPNIEYITEHFALLGFNEYQKLGEMREKSPSRYWKVIMLYCYICMKLGYKPVQNQCSLPYWTFRQNNISDVLGEAFSQQTVSNIMKDLKTLKLIDFASAHVKRKNIDAITKCIGTVVIINTSTNPTRQQELMDEAKQLAIADYIANSNKAADN